MLQLLLCVLLFDISKSELKLSISSSYLEPGESVTVTCTSNNQNENKFWTKNGSKITSGGFYIVFDALSSVSLIIRNVNNSTIGDYLCMTESGDQKTYSLHLKSELIQFRNCIDRVYAKIGERAFLPCTVVFKEVDGNPLFFWQKDGQTLIQNSMIQLNEEGLLINSLVPTDEGVYEIIGVSRNFVSRAKQIVLSVKYGPLLTFKSQFLRIGRSSEITCSVASRPTSTVTLFVNGTVMPIYYEDVKLFDKFTVIKSTIKLDNITNLKYNITCRADNGLDQSQISHYFLTADVPDVVDLVVTGNVVTWKPSNANGSNITQYLIKIDSDKSSLYQKYIQLNPLITEINLTDYINETGIYNVSVMGENEVGRSPPAIASVYFIVPLRSISPSSSMVIYMAVSSIVVLLALAVIVLIFVKHKKGKVNTLKTDENSRVHDV